MSCRTYEQALSIKAHLPLSVADFDGLHCRVHLETLDSPGVPIPDSKDGGLVGVRLKPFTAAKGYDGQWAGWVIFE